MTRIRRDPRDRKSIRRPAQTVAPEVRNIRVLDCAAKLVVAVLAGEAGALTESECQTLVFGRALADQQGLELLALIAGELPKGIEAAGVDRIAIIPHDGTQELTAILIAMRSALPVRYVVGLEDTPLANALRRMAAQNSLSFRGSVARLTKVGCDCLEDGGKTQRARSLTPVMLAARDHFRHSEGERPGAAQTIDLPAVEVPPSDFRDLGLERPDSATLALTEAHLILSAGAGVSDWPLFHQLARTLGAAEAGSRVVCDAGHLPRERQIGASGMIVAPRCYIALGISGAAQHLQGIAGANCVVAVNHDPHAPILARADLAVRADSGQVMHRLLELLEAQS